MLALVHTFLTLMLLLVWKGTEQRPTTALRWQTALYLSIQIFIKDGISGREKPAVVGISCDHHKKDKTHSSAVKSQAFPLQEAPDWSGAERALLGGLPTKGHILTAQLRRKLCWPRTLLSKNYSWLLSSKVECPIY